MPATPPNIIEFFINAILWLGGAIGALFIALLTFLLKKYIDNFEKTQTTLKECLLKLEDSLLLLREDNATLKAQVSHLESNVKTGFSAHKRLLEDIVELEKTVLDLEKEDIKVLGRLINIEEKIK